MSFVKIVKRHLYVSIYQLLGNVDMHMYAKCDQNKQYGSRVMNIFTNWTDSHKVIIVSTQESCNVLGLYTFKSTSL